MTMSVSCVHVNVCTSMAVFDFCKRCCEKIQGRKTQRCQSLIVRVRTAVIIN
eukprot:m.54924 g.54924  ORF g.54924 m.54924 type:complete len:52 (-) comp21993_c0_seq1:163-318(-)